MLKLYITYDVNVMTSYQVSDWVEKMWGNKVKKFDEIRDNYGYLKGFDVEVEVDA